MEYKLLDSNKWLGTPTNEPTLCAVSLQNTVGAHHARHSLGSGFYVYVNDDVSHLLTDEHRGAWLSALPKAQPAPKSTKDNKRDDSAKENE